MFSLLCNISTAQARSSKPSVYSLYAKDVATLCLNGRWETQQCLAAVSESSLVLAANYAETLSNAGHEFAVEEIKEHCAAGTAATKGEYPAYALKSAWIECANTMYDLSETTGIEPNPSHYQLLVGPILCLEKDRRCQNVEVGLRRFQ